MTLRTTILVFMLLTVASVLISCGEHEPLMEVSIGEIAQDYVTNAFRADEKYDQPFLVSGRVSEIQSNGILRLAAGGYTHVEAEVRREEDLMSLNRGDNADLRCDGAQGSSDSLGALSFIWKDASCMTRVPWPTPQTTMPCSRNNLLQVHQGSMLVSMPTCTLT